MPRIHVLDRRDVHTGLYLRRSVATIRRSRARLSLVATSPDAVSIEPFNFGEQCRLQFR